MRRSGRRILTVTLLPQLTSAMLLIDFCVGTKIGSTCKAGTTHYTANFVADGCTSSPEHFTTIAAAASLIGAFSIIELRSRPLT